MTDDPDVTQPDIRQAARDAATLLRRLRHEEPKTLLPRTDPDQED